MIPSNHPGSIMPAAQEQIVRRRRYQKGSLQLRRRGKSKRWVVLFYDADGHRRYKTLGAGSLTKSEVEDKRVEFMRTINGGDPKEDEPRPVLLQEFVNQVYFPFQRGKWKSSTRESSESRIQHHILKELGNRPVEAFTLSGLQAFLERKAGAGLSFSVVDHLRWDLSSMLEMAVAEKVITTSPATKLYTPKTAKQGEARAMTVAEVETVLNAVPPREKLILHLAIFSGFRPGEILAFRRQHVGAGAASIKVEQRVYRGELDDPKNGRARTVAIPPRTAALLREWLESAVEPDPDAWLFASAAGNTPVWRDNLLRRHIRPALEKVGLGWVDFKVMRRTNASLSHEAKVDPKVSADQRGHGIGVSIDVYTKTSIEKKASVAKKLEDSVLGRRAKVVRMPKRKAS